jgi:hypothetical protein
VTETSDFANLKKPALILRASDDFVFTDDKVKAAEAATEETAKQGIYTKV